MALQKLEDFAYSGRRRGGRPVIGLACGLALLAVSACGGPANTVPDDEAVLQQNERASELIRIGNELRDKGDLVSAADLYGRAVRADSKSPLPPALLGDTLRRLGRYREAEQIFREALDRNPFSGLSLQGYGILMIETGKPESAIAALTTAVDEESADYRVYNVLGIAYDKLGDHGQAQAQYMVGLEQKRDSPSLLNNMAISLALQERYDAAIDQMQKAADFSGDDPTYRHNLALIYGLAGRIEDAASIARTLLPAGDVANNLAFYQELRALDGEQRRAKVLEVVLRSLFVSANGAPE